MTLCIINGAHCTCQPDEGMLCVEAGKMKVALVAANERIKELETALANAVNADWHNEVMDAEREISDKLLRLIDSAVHVSQQALIARVCIEQLYGSWKK